MSKRMEALALSIFMWAACASGPFSLGARAENLNLGDTTATTVKALFINVGKGDAILLMLGEQRYLIDTGTKESADAMLKALEYYQVSHLDGVIITHTDKDHVGGLKTLLKSKITVDHLYASAFYVSDGNSPHPVARQAEKYDLPLTWMQHGDVIDVNTTMRLNTLGPLTLDEENENNNSLVLRLETPEGAMLLTGDMEVEEEADLLSVQAIRSALVLKVGHHGDEDASSESFIYTVRPQIAVISTSTLEAPETPSSKVIKRLWNVGAEVFITQKATCGVQVALMGGNAIGRLINYESD